MGSLLITFQNSKKRKQSAKKNDENLDLNFDSLEKYIIQNVGHTVKS